MRGTVAVVVLEISDGDVAVEGGVLLTDPVTVDANGDISGYGTVTGTTTNNGTVNAVGGPLADSIGRRRLQRAGPRPNLPLTGDPDLHPMIDGRRIDSTVRLGSAHAFAL